MECGYEQSANKIILIWKIIAKQKSRMKNIYLEDVNCVKRSDPEMKYIFYCTLFSRNFNHDCM